MKGADEMNLGEVPADAVLFGRIIVTARGCWERQGANNQGYATIGVRKHNWRVGRLVCVIFHGRMKKGDEVCHTCDNPPCINPSHIYIGTHAHNMQDRARKGRNGPRARRLTLAKVVAMREEYATGKITHAELADKHNASINTVAAVLQGRSWKKRQGRPISKPPVVEAVDESEPKERFVQAANGSFVISRRAAK